MSEDIDIAYSRNSDPVESLQAASHIETGAQMRHLLVAMLFMSRAHSLPASDGDIYKAVHKRGHWDTGQGLRSRRHEAVCAGWVEKADRLGISPTGRNCARWRLTNDGIKRAKRFQKEAER